MPFLSHELCSHLPGPESPEHEVNFRVERGIKGPKAVEVEVVAPGTKDWSSQVESVELILDMGSGGHGLLI